MTNTPTPTFPPVFPLLRRGRSKGTLGDPFLAETKRTGDTEVILDQEYDPHRLRTAIAQAINTITPKMKLKVDGSNFSDWEDDMAMLFDDFLDNPEYLTMTGHTTYGEKLCRSILTHSVSNIICKSIIHICPCSAIYEHLKSHYHILTRVLQVLSWTNLLTLWMEEGERATALVYRMWSKVRDFKNRHGSFREDHLLGILLQHATRSQPTISNLVMNKLEAIVSTYSQPPNLGKVIAVIKSSAQQVTSQKDMTTPGKTNLPTFQKLNIAGNYNAEEMGNEEFLKDSFDPEALRAMQKDDTRMRTEQEHVPRILPNPRPFINATTSDQYDTNTPTTFDTTSLYQPRYKSPEVQARSIEMGAEEPDVMVLSTDISHTENFIGNAVCESGASHSLTGDQSALCRYQKLTKPIPLSVATKCTGRRSYVEGIGSLVFRGKGDKTAIVNRVFFSPSALIQAGGKLSSDGNDISI
ncbi:hypothetical protein O181_055987 [Austropuccinia psidii MF-1]|uniref:Uncharacterized protein n=1 Tax=Austropuccinia psidii MF-1 TaxID=1389203 RepID=A0A9Q3EET8_9BASI|nr:hypothetical protein [Austropuccinia psidii MF-1]